MHFGHMIVPPRAKFMQLATFKISNMTIKCQLRLYFDNHIRFESRRFWKQELQNLLSYICTGKRIRFSDNYTHGFVSCIRVIFRCPHFCTCIFIRMCIICSLNYHASFGLLFTRLTRFNRHWMAEILPIRRKTLYNQSINQSI